MRKAQKIDGGLPSYIQTQMSANIAFDFGIGLIPIVGDIVNIAYKANSRNCLLLESYLRRKYGKSQVLPETRERDIEQHAGINTTNPPAPPPRAK